ncbi:MAG: hypothetical protein K6B15_05410 [Parasporobacterium sp.]|nr:hypothetical protein [Parasporobacterium sp.]
MDLLNQVGLSARAHAMPHELSGGQQFNPFSQDDDGLGVTILKQMAKQIDYDWKDGRSLIKVAL